MARAKKDPNAPTVIKKYANRRLYDTGQSCYVTLDDLCGLIKEGHDFVVQDAKTEEDITHSVLTQIIAEQESKGQNVLSTDFLRKLIGFYGDHAQPLMPKYLSYMMDMFEKNQDEIVKQMEKPLEEMNAQLEKVGDVFAPSPMMKEMTRQNMAMFENTMKMFTPFGMSGMGGFYGSSNDDGSRKEELERQIAELQNELKKMV